MKRNITIALLLCLNFSFNANSQLRKGNFFITLGSESLTKTNELFDQYPQTDSSKITDDKLKISYAVNYGITNYLSIGLYSHFIKNGRSSYQKNSFGPVLRYYLPIKKFQEYKFYGSGPDDNEDDLIYLKHFLYVETSVLFGTVRHDSISFNNKEYSMSLGGTLRFPSNSKKVLRRLGLDLSVGIKYYTRTSTQLEFSPVLKGGLVFYFDNKFTSI